MLSLKQKKKVVDNKIIVEIPKNFGNEVEVIILSDADEQKSEDANHLYDEKNWANLTVKEFLDGYNSDDSIYDKISK